MNAMDDTKILVHDIVACSSYTDDITISREEGEISLPCFEQESNGDGDEPLSEMSNGVHAIEGSVEVVRNNCDSSEKVDDQSVYANGLPQEVKVNTATMLEHSIDGQLTLGVRSPQSVQPEPADFHDENSNGTSYSADSRQEHQQVSSCQLEGTDYEQDASVELQDVNSSQSVKKGTYDNELSNDSIPIINSDHGSFNKELNDDSASEAFSHHTESLKKIEFEVFDNSEKSLSNIASDSVLNAAETVEKLDAGRTILDVSYPNSSMELDERKSPETTCDLDSNSEPNSSVVSEEVTQLNNHTVVDLDLNSSEDLEDREENQSIDSDLTPVTNLELNSSKSCDEGDEPKSRAVSRPVVHDLELSSEISEGQDDETLACDKTRNSGDNYCDYDCGESFSYDSTRDAPVASGEPISCSPQHRTEQFRLEPRSSYDASENNFEKSKSVIQDMMGVDTTAGRWEQMMPESAVDTVQYSDEQTKPETLLNSAQRLCKSIVDSVANSYELMKPESVEHSNEVLRPDSVDSVDNSRELRPESIVESVANSNEQLKKPESVVDSVNDSLEAENYCSKFAGDDEIDDDDPNALTIDTGWLNEGGTTDLAKPDNKFTNVTTASDDNDSDALTIDTSKFDLAFKKKQSPKCAPLKLTIPRSEGAERKSKGSDSRKGRRRKTVEHPTTNSSDLKCPRCPLSSFSTVAAFVDHQRMCGMVASPPVAPQEIPKGAPRKVYMCSSCGSYMENWEMFVHMKEMHKRNICLHCLVMFSQSSKLSQHIVNKHKGIIEVRVQSAEDFSRQYPGPYSVLCSDCGRICNVTDFDTHFCSTVCSHCGLEGTHYPTCRLAPPPVLNAKKKRAKSGQRQKPKKQQQPVQASPLQERPPETQSTEPSGLQFSPTTFHERKMMELYRAPSYSKPQEKPLPISRYSTAESIEESINRVLESVASPTTFEGPPQETPPREPSPPPVSPPFQLDLSLPIEQPKSPSPVPDVAPMPEKEQYSEPDTSDSEKLTIELNPRRRKKFAKITESQPDEDAVMVAGEETPFTCVPLPEPLVKARVPTAMKLFVRATALTCVYCAHARKIAVNAKQLALHQLSQHRYVTIAESSTHAEKSACHSAAVSVMRDAIPSLVDVFFNAYGFDSSDNTAWRSADRVYECFHCSIVTADAREFSQHNRKFHSNDMGTKRRTETHLCIMCKTRFLTYSELLCHLCRGVYVSGQIIDPSSKYRCYCCDIQPLPSSFRLMVHLRLTHITCDMCFTVCDSQLALQTHVASHKALHYCYACALTYESRSELSKHIFWKHGAESATCKRCDKKKWKHAYHFCLPAPVFTCPECKLDVRSALALRVHSRLHQGEAPHACTECPERFISKKLLGKHTSGIHTRFKQEDPPAVNGSSPLVPALEEGKKKQKKDKKKDLRDLFDLPPVNLSESDDSSSDEQPKPVVKFETDERVVNSVPPPDAEPSVVDSTAIAGTSTETAPAAVWDGVLASLQGTHYAPDSPFYNLPAHRVISIATDEHDYCRPLVSKETIKNSSSDHDYCNNSANNNSSKHSSPRKQSKRPSSSDSSSSSASSCSCGSNCSCSSSTSSTESASSGEPRLKELNRKKKLLTKAERKKAKGLSSSTKSVSELESHVDVGVNIAESDLDTDELITDDEEFYELNPALRASEVLQHNRNILLDKLDVEPSPSTPRVTPSAGFVTKKRKRGRQPGSSGKSRKRQYTSTPYMRDVTSTTPKYEEEDEYDEMGGRRPKRKRVPLKYYGFSSEDEEYNPNPSVRKREKPVEHNTTIPASPPSEVAHSPEPSNLWNPPAWRAPPVAPKVNPIKIRTGSLKQTFAKSNNSDEFHIKRAELGGFHVNGTDSSSTVKNEKLYCFCQCPYDEVSEMIACDAVDCVIEWFHFECVGIMDPPKGKWFCPDCKKKAAAESEMMGIPFR